MTQTEEFQRITVAVDRPYDVVIGRGLAKDLSNWLPQGFSRVAIFHAPALAEMAQTLASQIGAIKIELPDAESGKTSETLISCWQQLAEAGFTRNDCLVALGGGATTDLVGFVAATWLRGIEVIHVPTTLLAMVDAAVGGKTGINLPQGKNLVGAFHHPFAVICDLDTLQTLPESELRQGMAEVVKCGFISDPEILQLCESPNDEILKFDSPVLAQLIARAIQVKAAVVAGDFKENQPGGLGREILNYGHTLGHAIEKVENYRLRHGEAISVGMAFVAELALLAGVLSEAARDRHLEILNKLGLPTKYSGVDWSELRAAMDLDKKTRGSQLRFIVLDEIGSPTLLTSPSEDLLVAAFERVSGGE